ncbi:MAG TPA: amidohydrolase family protein [Pirellulales bacterium]
MTRLTDTQAEAMEQSALPEDGPPGPSPTGVTAWEGHPTIARKNAPGLTRRACLRSLAAAAAATAVSQSRLLAADAPAALDAHTHFYDPRRPQGVPWPSKEDALLYRPVLPDELKRLTGDLPIRGVIAVEASQWLEDNQWLLDLASREPFIVGVVGRLDSGRDDFARQLARFAKDKRFCGLRVNHDELRQALADPPRLDRLRMLAEHDLELDVNGGPQLPADVARLAQAAPRLRIVINHAANLKIDGQAVPEAWLSGMRAAAASERVYCKVSALVEGTRKTHGDAPTDVAHYRPVLDALWTTFGADRLIYGSNWPVSDRAAPYAAVYRIVATYFQDKGPLAAEKFFHGNALAAYRPVWGGKESSRHK